MTELCGQVLLWQTCNDNSSTMANFIVILEYGYVSIIDIEVNYRKNKKGVQCSIVKGKGRV
jgi:hypothetical protein